MSKTYYITTTLPYVNAVPHIGFALEIVEADVLARYHRLLGENVIFNTGTDEHGVKIYRKSREEKKDPQAYCDEMEPHWKALKDLLNLSYTHFIRTTNADHMVAAQELWRRCDANGDIYKKEYKVKYCVGCELEKMDSELAKGKCPEHPHQDIEYIQEDNYFFRWSHYQQKLLDLYEKNPEFVIPKKRLNEIRAFIERGLEDFSISRLKEKMPWGVSVPGDGEHVMYVWFDALTNYISTLGWPNDEENFRKWWPGVQIAGKDNLRQQSAMWQAMLMSAGIEPSKQIYINGFISVDGQKMSKSLGNVIAPSELIEKFSVDGTRYLLLSLGALGEDFDVSWEKMIEKYNADLANGLGNLVSRVVTLGGATPNSQLPTSNLEFPKKFRVLLDEARIYDALEYIWERVRAANKYIDEMKPWELKKTDEEKFGEVMEKLFKDLRRVAFLLMPFLPETSERIQKILEIGEKDVLFKRLNF